MSESKGKRGWRYQAVYEDDEAGRQFSFCEVWIDADDKLESWAETAGNVPCGETLEELTRDLVRMYVDASRWEPVAFDALHVGMSFQKLISRKEAEDIAEMFEAYERAGPVIDAARAYRQAETDGTPRMWRGKELQDLANALDAAIDEYDSGRAPEQEQHDG